MDCCAIRLMIRHRLIRLDICKSQMWNFYQQALSHKYCAGWGVCVWNDVIWITLGQWRNCQLKWSKQLTWNKIIRHQMIMCAFVCRASVTLHRDFDLVFGRVSSFTHRNALLFFCTEIHQSMISLIRRIDEVFSLGSLRMNCAEDIAYWCEFQKLWKKTTNHNKTLTRSLFRYLETIFRSCHLQKAYRKIERRHVWFCCALFRWAPWGIDWLQKH